jgi:hypothetical protein
MNPIDIIESVCRRPTMFVPEMETPTDLLAMIRGTCVGLTDPRCSLCLGDFPVFVRSRLPEYWDETWFFALSRTYDENASLREACDAILELIQEWKATKPNSLGNELRNEKKGTIDVSTFRLMEEVLRQPAKFVPGASRLQEVLSFLWGLMAVRYPPHGSIAGIMEFSVFVNRYFHKSAGLRMQDTLLRELSGRSVHEACVLIAELIKQWLELNQQY